ncbi:hypothetical protein Taro_010250 [Colocasia esculenta]|uniref:Uncharacterized protein n=1 Tax=Colocasia esculenta TaxID=4460 RepID=A0A843U901_COLES|nr:hypothetical protein [Colocasia esculenta]
MIIHRVKVVSTQCFKYKAKRSSSVDTSSGSVDTRDSSQKTFWPIWDSVSTLAQDSVDTPLTGVDIMLQTQDKIMQNWSSSVDTISGSVNTVLQILGKKVK